MKAFRAELHVHTVLSPCAEVEMIPPLIVQEAVQRGIQVIAITDHNSSANVSAVQKASKGYPITVLPGMEVQTLEEVHVICLFDQLTQLADWQEIVNHSLPNLENNAEYFGEQFIVDENGEFIQNETRMLLTSTRMSIETVCDQVVGLGGIAIPAHVERQTFGLLNNLGFVPEGLKIAALEISRFTKPQNAYRAYPQLASYPLIQSGDVHRLNEFLGSIEISVESIAVGEIFQAFQHQNGRSYRFI